MKVLFNAEPQSREDFLSFLSSLLLTFGEFADITALREAVIKEFAEAIRRRRRR